MNRKQTRSLKFFFQWIVAIFYVFLLFSCDKTSTSKDTGGLVVKMSYHNTNDEFRPQATKINCKEIGLATIEAIVYEGNKHLSTGGPWNCELGKGTIEKVTAGKDRTVVIVGKNSDEKIILRGEKSEINVTADSNNETGPIDCYDFVPKLKNSELETTIHAGTAQLEWEIVPGAKEYRVIVWKDSSLNDLHVQVPTTQTYYSLTDLGKRTYYWQVVAIDAQGNESDPSGIRPIGMNLLFSVAAGMDHTLAIKQDGTLWSWGRNQYGQLGLDDGEKVTERSTPTQIGSDRNWARVAAGAYHSVGLKTDGTLWTWGYNTNYELGHGPFTEEYYTPTQVGNDKDWELVVAGDNHTIAKKTDGTLWAWGANSYGQLGLGHDKPESRPISIDNGDWAIVTAAADHTLAVKNNGELWAWGGNYDNELGTIESSKSQTQMVKIDSAKDWAYVTTGLYHTLAIKTNGELWAWGNNDYGQLGLNDTDKRIQPIQVGTGAHWTYAVAGDSYTLAIDDTGELWAWGNNDYGLLGTGDTIARLIPEIVLIADSFLRWAFVSSKSDHTVGVSIDGKVLCWGKNEYGELGNGNSSQKKVPTQVNDDTDWDRISSGIPNEFSIVKKKNGELWAWGRNNLGQLGMGHAGNQKIPMKIESDQIWNFATCWPNRALAVKTTDEDRIRTLWTWGNSEEKNMPETVDNNGDWALASIGEAFSIAIKEANDSNERTLWAWGQNYSYELGLGDDGERTIPTQVGTDTNWAFVASGGKHTIATKSNGSLWAWGHNYYGQLGVGDEESRNVPTLLGAENNTGWKFVAAGPEHSIAIKTDGSLWAWGYNQYGQLGLDDKNHRNIPVRVSENENSEWISVATGPHHTVAVKTNGTLWAWGNNSSGLLGIKDVGEETLIPLQVGTDGDWVDVGCGSNHTLAIKKDGTLWSWGNDNYGQLGNGDAWQADPIHIPLKASD